MRAGSVSIETFHHELNRLKNHDFSKQPSAYRFPHIRITNGAFSELNENQICSLADFLGSIKDENVCALFRFAGMATLEEVSFTRKDGQYLRWDHRASRSRGKRFEKGRIPEFQDAIIGRLHGFLDDIKNRNGGGVSGNVEVIRGSCLYKMAEQPDSFFDLLVTSPPYCNRYDYTRTYALELAFLGCGEQQIKYFRQALLSATVENKSKRQELRARYCSLKKGRLFS